MTVNSNHTIVSARDSQEMTRSCATRRSILQSWLAASAVGFGVSNMVPSSSAQGQLPPTPSCDANARPTVASTEGPFYKPRTPRNINFRQNAPGEALTLVGFVVGRECRPIASAVVDLWHADARGGYDNDGYKLRGHQLTDAEGHYMFETIVQAPYDRRTRHYHVKVQPPGGAC